MKIKITNKINEIIDKYKIVKKSKIQQTDKEIKLLNKMLNEGQKEQDNRGFIYRMYFPNKYSVGVYDDISQTSCDTIDRAASVKLNKTRIVAAQNYKGYEAIKSFEKYKTTINVSDGDKVIEYIVTDKFEGKNTGMDLEDENGSVLNRNQNGITLYTYNEKWQDVTIAFLQPTGKIYKNKQIKSRSK